MNTVNNIPKIIHQLWIGPKPMPSKMMDTWRDKHHDYTYIRWTESEIQARGIKFECQSNIDSMVELNGKADIMRWEILYHFGGIFIDADSICIEPFDNFFLSKNAFAGFENENVRKGLVATGTMGFVPKHPLCRAAIDWILANDTCVDTCGHRAWYTVGPGLLTRLLETGKYTSFMVYPSYTFLPIHFTGDRYTGHKKVYAYQEWGSTRQNYENMNSIELPDELKEPKEWVSVLISSYNTKHMYVHECIESIKSQNGHFGIELVWINDGSDNLSTRLLELELEKFKETSRWTKVIYEKMPTNVGISVCLKRGIEICSNEIIIKMDSDDIMHVDRIKTQLHFMHSYPDCVLCGSNVELFSEDKNTNTKKYIQTTNHPEIITWENYKIVKSHWFMNHPSLCYKKSAILSVGNYNTDMNSMSEDFELELRVLKKYGIVYNIKDTLLYYRIHPDQATYNGKSSTIECNNKRLEVIDRIISS
jgi:GT2 family glycosyltransferase